MTSEKRGRPRRSSTRALEEAAAELFLEQGYSHTTVDDIASRAGVSRATFFNYFHNKSDVLWVDVDRALVYLSQSVMEESPGGVCLGLLGLLVFRKGADSKGEGAARVRLGNTVVCEVARVD